VLCTQPQPAPTTPPWDSTRSPITPRAAPTHLVVRDAEGKVYSVRYEAVNAMLLNEFLKEHRTVQELKSIVAKQEVTAAQQQKQIEALTIGLQKVSAQIEVTKPAPQVVDNNQ
jgi:uncharacterized coiled-coil protein SlyX